MAFQTQSNALVAYKVQSALGTQATGADAEILRQAGGQGGRLTKASVESAEIRSDMLSSRGRHGSQRTAGAYTSELSIGSHDTILEAVLRGTFGSADLEITEATSGLTSITTGANTIIASAGSWITAGLRVGDVIRLTNHQTTANNGKNLRITALTATTITVAETLTADAVADSAFTVTRPGRVLINPTAPVRRYFSIEEYETDIDVSELFTDCVWGSLRMSMQPNGLFMVDTGWVGTGQFETVASGDAPHFTSPAQTTALPLAALEATVRKGSTDLVDLTAFDLTVDITPSAPDVIGSDYAPDVFTGTMQVSLNLTTLRSDLADVSNLLDETELSLHVLLVEPESEPKDFISIHVPNFTLGAVDKSELAKAGGGRTQTLAVPAELVGKDTQGGAFDETMIKLQVSNS